MADVLSALTKKKLGVSEQNVDPAEKAAFQKGAATLGSLENRLQKKAEYQQADAEDKLSIAMQELEKTRDREMGTGEIVAKSLIALAPLLGYAVRTKGGQPSYATGAIIGQASQTALKGIDEAIERERAGKEEQAKTKLGIAVEKSKEAARDVKETEKMLLANKLEAARAEQRFKQEQQLKGAELGAKPPKPLQQHEFKAANFATQMERAEAEFDALLRSGYDPSDLSQDIQSSRFYPERLKGENRKRYESAERRFIMGILRPETGAAISEQEYEETKKAYFPQPGDSFEQQAMKKQARLLKIASTKAEAGGAYQAVKTALGEEPSSGVSIDTQANLPQQLKTAGAELAMKPMRVVQNGIEYRLNPETGRYE